jgi:hypothetical protein
MLALRRWRNPPGLAPGSQPWRCHKLEGEQPERLV